MADTLNGTVQKLMIKEKQVDGFLLEKGFFLPQEDDFKIGQRVEAFIYEVDDKKYATTKLPEARFHEFGWAEVTAEINHEGLRVNIGVSETFFVFASDLPAVETVWPQAGDKLYVHLKRDRKNNLFAVPAKEKDFSMVIEDASDLDLNEMVTGTVIRAGKEGTVILTENHYRAFIHHSERQQEPRMGAEVTARVIEVKEDGTLNASLLPLKQERMADDAERIFVYLEANGGEIPFHNKSEPERIKETFGMSKSAFKRAIGRLLKEGKIKLGEASIIQNK